MKRFAPLMALLALLVFAVPQAQAQMTFFNGTNCPVRVLGGYNYTPNPCAGLQCETPWYTVPANSSITIPGANNCPSISSPPPQANFFGFKLLVSNFSGTSVDICNTPTSSIQDCQGNLRTVEIFNFNFGAIY